MNERDQGNVLRGVLKGQTDGKRLKGKKNRQGPHRQKSFFLAALLELEEYRLRRHGCGVPVQRSGKSNRLLNRISKREL